MKSYEEDIRKEHLVLSEDEAEVVDTLWRFWREGDIDAFIMLSAHWPIAAGRILYSAFDQGTAWEAQRRLMAQEPAGRA